VLGKEKDSSFMSNSFLSNLEIKKLHITAVALGPRYPGMFEIAQFS
jgi:hypothetical protein